MWKEAIVTPIEVISQTFFGRTKKNYENSRPGQSVSEPRFEPRRGSRSVTNSKTILDPLAMVHYRRDHFGFLGVI
jgi:hypothetical protein